MPVGFLDGFVKDIQGKPLEDAIILIKAVQRRDRKIMATNSDGYYMIGEIEILGFRDVVCFCEGYLAQARRVFLNEGVNHASFYLIEKEVS